MSVRKNIVGLFVLNINIAVYSMLYWVSEVYAMQYKRIKSLREEHGLRQKDISKILNISRQLYSRYERGIQRLPVKHLITLSKYYNISVDYILNLSDIKRPINNNHIQKQ